MNSIKEEQEETKMANQGYCINFNQDYNSVNVCRFDNYRIFTLDERIEEIFARDFSNLFIADRLYGTSLLAVVTKERPHCIQMINYKTRRNICNCVYPSDILCVLMNRIRMIVFLAESIYIHNILSLKSMQQIENVAPNDQGLCALSSQSHIAYPICLNSGMVRIYDAFNLQPHLVIKAHQSKLSAMCFSRKGLLLATASERGTVIRVFCVQNGQRVQEFRRGIKRCVRIFSLTFAPLGDFLCASSNTETVHVFRMDSRLVDAAQTKPAIMTDENGLQVPAPEDSSVDNVKVEEAAATSWTDYISNAVTAYLLPTQVSEVLSQDRAFATAIVPQPGMKYACAVTRIQKQLKLVMACEDGFLYVYSFDPESGGQCKQESVHDLRCPLDGIVELNIKYNSGKWSSNTAVDIIVGAACSESTLSTLKDAASCQKSNETDVVIENADDTSGASYASVLRGQQAVTPLTDSAKIRKLCDAIDTPIKLYDERQFPPVAIAAKE